MAERFKVGDVVVLRGMDFPGRVVRVSAGGKAITIKWAMVTTEYSRELRKIPERKAKK